MVLVKSFFKITYEIDGTGCHDHKHGIQSHHFVAKRWGNNGNSDRFYFGGSKITADGDCSHEIKRCLLLRRKVMTNLDRILKSRNITLVMVTKGPSNNSSVFFSSHVWM